MYCKQNKKAKYRNAPTPCFTPPCQTRISRNISLTIFLGENSPNDWGK